MRLTPFLFILTVAPVLAQPLPGNCSPGTAEASLDIGDVHASVFNTATLFYGTTITNGDGYIVPKSSGVTGIFAASFWMSGRIGGETRAIGARYGGHTLWPGPLGPGARPPDPSDCSAYDRIYSVSRYDVETYYRTGTATADLRDWPWRLGAPVLDGDGDPANYDLAAGDQPAIRGDQMAWWLTNDVAGVRNESGLPLGVEVRVEASAFVYRPLDQTTMYRYTITNRTDTAIDSAYVGLWADPSAGDLNDDYFAADTTVEMGIAYNSDGTDPSFQTPPALGVQIVSGPVGLPNARDDDGDGAVDEAGERLGMTAFTRYTNGTGPTVEPSTPVEYNRFLRGLWRDGTPIREGGGGYGTQTGPITTFIHPGDPVTAAFWSAYDTGGGVPSSPGTRRFTVSTGPFRLEPGQSQTVAYAIPFAQGTSHLDSVVRLRVLARILRNAERAGAFEPVAVERTGAFSPQPPTQAVRLSAPSPNPFTVRAVVRYEMPAGTPLRATLHDVLGRRIAVLVDAPTTGASGEIAVDGRGLAPGVFRVRVSVPAGERIVTLIRAR